MNENKIIWGDQFNWLQALEAAIKEEPSFNECEKLEDLANRWPTCACGQLCKKLPRREDSSPEDDKARILGLQFLTAVNDGNWKGALSIFKEIEYRTADLLSRVGVGQGVLE